MLAHLIEFANNHYLLTSAFVVALALLVFSETRRGARSISNRELTALVNGSGAVIVDIRAHKDFAAGHIVQALNIPLEKLAERMVELEKHKSGTIIVIDAAGQHAGGACRSLKEAGYEAVKLSAGISGWRGDNLPVVK
ncbi:Rhodanese-related sulfurtransferase [Pseudomonas pohangensis]|jgi:rhodanese-related sulfurtransferase|uniref:Rhodanese-related sulfurtransferase n=1 Tax=Pseudomonas pohangensis TaxID=364197 RepID=A0A1H2DWT9_9PSED|nr:rhodanese-like domain-containing protein [Pseudomonas pohangensis]SDT87302.1 Rhodanese-related sulfurtransferase [Pseudomonas pohangensis]